MIQAKYITRTNEIELTIEAEIEPADPEVGIMSATVCDLCIVATTDLITKETTHIDPPQAVEDSLWSDELNECEQEIWNEVEAQKDRLAAEMEDANDRRRERYYETDQPEPRFPFHSGRHG